MFLLTRFKRFANTDVLIFFIFLILPYLFFGLGVNILEIALAPGDGIFQGVPTKIYAARLQLWNQYNQSGTFPFKDIGWQSLYPPGILVMKLFPNPFGYNLLLLLHYSMAGMFTFLFLRRLRLKRLAAFIGGLIFMFCGFLTAHKGHHTMMMAAAYLPVVLYFLESFLTTGKMDWLILSGFSFGLGILADYAAVSMYIGMVTFPYLVFRVIAGSEFRSKPIRDKMTSILVAAFVVYVGGLLLAAIEILPILESLTYVTRQQISFDFFASYSFSWRLLPLLIFPYVYGATSSSFYQTPYFGPWNLSELAGYMGILPLFFAPLCFILFRKKNQQIYFWATVLVLAFLLVLGDSTPLYKLLYKVPVYNLFRAPARNWLEVNFAAAVLASFLLHHIITDTMIQAKSYYRVVHILVGMLLSLIFLILLFGKFIIDPSGILPLWLENTRLESRAIYVPLIIVVISISLLYALFRYRRSRNFWLVIAITIFIDLFSFGYFHDTGYASYKIFQKQPNPVVKFFEDTNSDKESYRIFPLGVKNYEGQLYPSINLLYGYMTVNAYSPIWLKDYAELTGFGTDGTVLKHQILSNSAVLSALSTRYVIAEDPRDKALVESIMLRHESDADNIIVGGFNDASWNFVEPFNRKHRSVLLATGGPASINSIQYSFPPSARTIYKVTFWARMQKKKVPNEVLAIDFYGENYDSPEQDNYIQPFEVSSEFRKFTIYLYSGENPPPFAFLRIFTHSNFPYEVKDIQFALSGRYLSWGEKESSAEEIPLYEKRYQSPDGTVVYENRNFLPRARFVKKLISVADSSAAIHALRHDDHINLATTAVVNDLDFSHTLDDGHVIHADYSKDSVVTLSVRTGAYSFLVLSDSWYPGWKAFIDGKETHIYRTNAVSRGVLIQGRGDHVVEFKFVPFSFYLGLLITSSAGAVMIVSLKVNRIDIRRLYSGNTGTAKRQERRLTDW